jgi:hypothetical protein
MLMRRETATFGEVTAVAVAANTESQRAFYSAACLRSRRAAWLEGLAVSGGAFNSVCWRRYSRKARSLPDR